MVKNSFDKGKISKKQFYAALYPLLKLVIHDYLMYTKQEFIEVKHTGSKKGQSLLSYRNFDHYMSRQVKSILSL